MPTLEEEEAFSHLRVRQGSGARYDADGAPALELTLARRGTAYFARLLNNLRDAELYQPSAVPGWNRAHVVAAVAYHAKDITRIVEAARLDVARVTLPSKTDREEDTSGTRLAKPLQTFRSASQCGMARLDDCKLGCVRLDRPDDQRAREVNTLLTRNFHLVTRRGSQRRWSGIRPASGTENTPHLKSLQRRIAPPLHFCELCAQYFRHAIANVHAG
jgi:hypothetical protein